MLTNLSDFQRTTVQARTAALAASIGLDLATVPLGKVAAIAKIAAATLGASDSYFDLVVGASLDWQASQFRYLSGKVHEHSANEVKAFVIATVARFQHGAAAFDQAVAS